MRRLGRREPRTTGVSAVVFPSFGTQFAEGASFLYGWLLGLPLRYRSGTPIADREDLEHAIGRGIGTQPFGPIPGRRFGIEPVCHVVRPNVVGVGVLPGRFAP